MKKTILIATTLFLSFHFQAQIAKGTKFIGLDLSFNKGKSDNLESSYTVIGDNYNFYIAPGFNYFINDHFSIGGNLGAGFGKYSTSQIPTTTTSVNYINTYGSKSNSYSAGMNGAYYKLCTDRLYFVGQFNLFYNYSYRKNSDIYHINNDIHDSYSTTIGNNVIFSFTPGFTYFINSKFAVNLKTSLFSLQFQKKLYKTNYTHIYEYSSEYNQNVDYSTSQNSFSKNLSLSNLSISINYFF